jgi:hypothetical protein
MRGAPESTDRPLILPPKAAPAPAPAPAEVWKPTDTKGIEVNQRGQQRTKLPLPPAAPYVFPTWPLFNKKLSGHQRPAQE